MRTSTFVTAALAGALVYAFATPRGRRARRRLFDDRLGSSDWLRAHRPGLADELADIERRLDALGDDLRARLAELPRPAQPQPAPSDEWHVDDGDVSHDLRGLQSR